MATATRTSDKLDFEHVWLLFKETKELLESRAKDTELKFKATDKKLNQLEQLFTGQWGKLMESLVEGDLIRLLNEKGIKVVTTTNRTKSFHNNRQYEFDIIAENGDDVVVVEVKTTLKPSDIKEFLSELKVIKSVLPKYKSNRIIGAVAYLTDQGNAAYMAENKGLYVIRATGSSANITNSADFQPKFW